MDLSSRGNLNRDMRDGWNPRTQESQTMRTLVRGQKVVKGVKTVLEEWDLWI